MSDCIIWQGYTMPNGYGQIYDRGRMRLVHVVVCARHHGPRPGKMQVAHSCGNRACINPEHLRWATQSENEMDKVEHGRGRRGSRHPLAKLTEREVREIRYEYATGDWTHKQLADEFGVSRSQITKILNGYRWAH